MKELWMTIIDLWISYTTLVIELRDDIIVKEIALQIYRKREQMLPLELLVLIKGLTEL